jgi:hypothetical protein
LAARRDRKRTDILEAENWPRSRRDGQGGTRPVVDRKRPDLTPPDPVGLAPVGLAPCRFNTDPVGLAVGGRANPRPRGWRADGTNWTDRTNGPAGPPFDRFNWLTAGPFDGFDKLTAGKLRARADLSGTERNTPQIEGPGGLGLKRFPATAVMFCSGRAGRTFFPA